MLKFIFNFIFFGLIYFLLWHYFPLESQSMLETFREWFLNALSFLQEKLGGTSVEV
ncbi:hypothetical protein AB751O23_AC_00180 [Chlamydiales bacterium SCGC AB-751-O23]|jgi:hypothetical protein|nr:hypothetical protein AB751O23_AC_00180 [Chlamydiales bacterium SCGC AB-751-O23]